MKMNMTIKPEDKPKMIGLGVAIFGVIAYLLITFIPKIGGDKPADSTTPGATPASATVATPATNAVDPAMSDLESDIVPPQPRTDIFQPPRGSAKPPEKNITSEMKPNSAPTSTAIDPPLPGMSGGTINQPPAPSSGMMSIPVPAPGPPILLSGVMVGAGSNPLAVISLNGVTYYRRTGESIGSLKIHSIQEAGIVVQEGTKLTPILVGHTLPNVSATVITVTSRSIDTPEALANAMREQDKGKKPEALHKMDATHKTDENHQSYIGTKGEKVYAPYEIKM